MKKNALPELPYDCSALEPHYSARLLELHHGKHHAAYVAGANATLEKLAAAREQRDFSAINQLQLNPITTIRVTARRHHGDSASGVVGACESIFGNLPPELAQSRDGYPLQRVFDELDHRLAAEFRDRARERNIFRATPFLPPDERRCPFGRAVRSGR